MAGKLNKPLAVFAIVVAIGVALFRSRRVTDRGSRPATSDDASAPAATLSRGGELVASIRAEPPTYNRYVDLSAPGEVLSLSDSCPSRPCESHHRHAGALAGGELDRVGRSPDLHDQAAAGRHLLRRRAPDFCRRPVLVSGALRSEGRFGARRRHADRRQTAAGRRARCRQRSSCDCRRHLRRACACSTESESSAPQAGAGADCRDVSGRLVGKDAVCRDRRARSLRARRARIGAAAGLHAQPALLEKGRRRNRSARTSTSSRSSSPIRPPRRCVCSPARST